MKQNSSSSGIDRRAVLSTLAAVPALSGTFLPTTTRAATGAADGGFSFAACGDTRPMMYLPQNDGQAGPYKLFVEMFGLVMPEKDRGSGGEAGCEDDLRSGHQRAHPDHHAVYDQE